jgi:crossover junction endodeoxyribonuclease RuvC
MPTPLAVGLDLSLTAAGIATPRGLFTVGETGKKGATLEQRRTRISSQVSRVLDAVLGEAVQDGPLVVALESPAQHAKTPGQHDRSGLWWRVVHELSSWPEVYVVEVGIAALKKYATGKGNAGKDEVLASVVRRYPDHLVADNNQADALVLRAMVADRYGAPLAEIPARQREALASVAWPAIGTEAA